MADNQRKAEHVLVTGATGGIGKAIAMELVKKGKNVYVTGRCQKKLDALVEELKGLMKDLDQPNQPNQTIGSFCFDLSYLTRVKEVMPDICKFPIDTVIFNAGVMFPKVCKGPGMQDEFPKLEETIKANVLGHFVMARHLLDHRRRREGEENHRALPNLRFVLVSSVMANYASKGKTAWPSDSTLFDEFFTRNNGWFSCSDGWLSYFDSKLAAIVMAEWLNEQMNTSAVAIHPGVARTEIFSSIPFYQRILLRPISWFQNFDETSVCAERIYGEAVTSNQEFKGKWVCNGVTDIPTNVNDVQKKSFMDFIRRLTDGFM